jgi:hypothetical protein
MSGGDQGLPLFQRHIPKTQTNILTYRNRQFSYKNIIPKLSYVFLKKVTLPT